VISPWATTTIAPPGCECQPDDPAGVVAVAAANVFMTTTKSVPRWRGSVPFDWSVPRASGVLVLLTAGVAPPGRIVAATIPSPIAKVRSASPARRLEGADIHVSFPEGRPAQCGYRDETNVRRRDANRSAE